MSVAVSQGTVCPKAFAVVRRSRIVPKYISRPGSSGPVPSLCPLRPVCSCQSSIPHVSEASREPSVSSKCVLTHGYECECTRELVQDYVWLSPWACPCTAVM